MLRLDLTGLRFGSMRVVGLSKVSETPRGHISNSYWLCKCIKCNSVRSIRSWQLQHDAPVCLECVRKQKDDEKKQKDDEKKQKDDEKKQKDAAKAQAHDYVGRRYHRLVVLSLAGTKWRADFERERCWLCRCDCGNEVIVSSSYLRLGKTKSCGCLRRDLYALKHEQARAGRNRKDKLREHSIRIVELKTRAYELLEVAGLSRKDFDLHHITPLGVGGSHSDIRNLILIPKFVHQSFPLHGTPSQQENYAKCFDAWLADTRKKAYRKLGPAAYDIDTPSLWLASEYPDEYLRVRYPRK